MKLVNDHLPVQVVEIKQEFVGVFRLDPKRSESCRREMLQIVRHDDLAGRLYSHREDMTVFSLFVIEGISSR